MILNFIYGAALIFLTNIIFMSNLVYANDDLTGKVIYCSSDIYTVENNQLIETGDFKARIYSFIDEKEVVIAYYFSDRPASSKIIEYALSPKFIHINDESIWRHKIDRKNLIITNEYSGDISYRIGSCKVITDDDNIEELLNNLFEENKTGNII